MIWTSINTDNTIFILISFEGPDIYSQAGGLGVRVTHLSQTLSREGFTTHLFFIGDPHLKGEETSKGGKLIIHRWCQWISRYNPAGVYQGESGKVNDFSQSLPPYLLEYLIYPALKEEKLVVVLAEEWQTAKAVIRLSGLLDQYKLREKVILYWNANNIFGFERINFKELAKATTITTVSRFMKQVLWREGLNPVVIPNGIPKNLLNRVDSQLSDDIRRSLGAELVLAKIARWDPDKRWNMAVEATAMLKARGLRTLLIARGGMEGYGDEILYNARSLGLRVKDVQPKGEGLDDLLESLTMNSDGADILNIKFHCSQDLLRIIYHAADGVLANSGREPFGLVGLETMAAGGIALTGSTGEDYAVSFYNSIVLETADPEEIESYVLYLANHPDEATRIRKFGRLTAARFTWEQIVESLIQRLEYQAKTQGLITPSRINRVSQSQEVPDFKPMSFHRMV
jgi:glycosyltransferase involved in cell wall biosynthesis